MDVLKLSVVSDIDHAHRLWEQHCPQLGLYDSWDFRRLFHEPFDHRLHFIVGEIGGQVVGIFPLQYNQLKNSLEFFGGTYMEDNRLLLTPGNEHYAAAFFETIDKPVLLNDIAESNEFSSALPFEEYKYTLSLADFSCFDDYIEAKYHGKTKANFKKRLRQAESYGATIVRNRLEDIEYLFTYNIKNFGDDSAFHMPHRKEIFHKLLKSPIKTTLLSYEINGAVQAVSIGALQFNTYVYMNAGVNKTEFPNLGSLIIKHNFEEAISSDALLFDAGVEDLGWKERWYLDRTPQHCFAKEA